MSNLLVCRSNSVPASYYPWEPGTTNLLLSGKKISIKKYGRACISGHYPCIGECDFDWLTLKRIFMKKTILMMLLAGSSCAVFAQNDTTNRNTGTNGNVGTNTNVGTNMGNNSYNTNRNGDSSMNGSWGVNNSMSSNNSYNAYGTFNATAPDYLNSYVLRDYPTATDIHWQQSADWWHGYYMNNGQPVNMYYNTAGQTFNVALPVRQSLVPDAVVSKAISMYGPMLYDITSVRGSNGQDIYMVRTLENGQVNSQWMGEDGSKVIDVYRTESTDMNNSTNNNWNSNMNGSTNGTMNNTNMNGTSNGTMNNSTNNYNNNNSTQTTNGQTSDQSGTVNDSSSSGTTSDMSSSNSGTQGKDKLKIKTKSSDGKKHKTKVVNGKTSTKGDQNQ
jgi:hypothetical protein